MATLLFETDVPRVENEPSFATARSLVSVPSPLEDAASRKSRGKRRRSMFAYSNTVASASRAADSTRHDGPLEIRPKSSIAQIDQGHEKRTETLNDRCSSPSGGRCKHGVVKSDVACFKDRSRPSSRNGFAAWAGLLPAQAESTRVEAEAGVRRRKASISPPFDFQHITHTSRKHLPTLQAVSETRLVSAFWAASDASMPRKYSLGMRVDDLRERIHRELGVPKLLPPSRPASKSPPSRSDDRPTTRCTTASDSVLARPATAPLRADSIGMEGRILMPAATLYSPRKSSSLRDLTVDCSLASHPSLASTHVQECRSSPGQGRSATATMQQQDHCALHDVGFRAQQALPALPRRSLSRSSSASSSSSGHDKDDWESVYIKSYAQPRSRSRRPAGSNARKARLSQLPEEGKHAMPKRFPYEDAIDFAYEHCAESTCDLDWSAYEPRPRSASTKPRQESKGSTTLPRPRLTQSISNLSVHITGGEAHDIPQSPLLERSGPDHRRGSSVGHRGFLAARNAGTTPVSPTSEFPNSGFASALASPSLSAAGGEMEIFAPSTSAMHPPRVDSANSGWANLFNHYGSHKHQKAGSEGSSTKSAWRSAGDDTPHLTSSSVSSFQEESHDSRQGNLETPSMASSSPLLVSESLSDAMPESPRLVSEHRMKSENHSLDSTGSEHEPFTMRRPQTRGDRAVLQAAGRAVQRGRPSTPHRFSRLLEQSNPQPSWF